MYPVLIKKINVTMRVMRYIVPFYILFQSPDLINIAFLSVSSRAFFSKENEYNDGKYLNKFQPISDLALHTSFRPLDAFTLHPLINFIVMCVLFYSTEKDPYVPVRSFIALHSG